jgi:hypothetical protein
MGLSNSCPFAASGAPFPSELSCCCRVRTPHHSLVFFFSLPVSTAPLPPMVRRHIPDDVKEVALSMSLQGIADSDIRKLTGVSERSLKRLRSTYRRKNTASAHPLPPGRPRVLTPTQVKVRHLFLKDILFSYDFSSFFAIALSASPTPRLLSYRQSSVRFAWSRRRYRQLHGLSDGRATP